MEPGISWSVSPPGLHEQLPHGPLEEAGLTIRPAVDTRAKGEDDRGGSPRLAPDLRPRARDAAVPDSYELPFASHMQRLAWTRLHNGYLRRGFGAMQRKGFKLGFEYQFPYFDRELVTCVFGIPRRCFPSNVKNGRIHREAFRTMLPREIRPLTARRTSRPHWSGAFGDPRPSWMISSQIVDGSLADTSIEEPRERSGASRHGPLKGFEPSTGGGSGESPR